MLRVASAGVRLASYEPSAVVLGSATTEAPMKKPAQYAATASKAMTRARRCAAVGVLALLWQIYLRCCSLQIHFLQYGHRCGGSRAISSRIAWRTAGNVG